MMEFYVGQIFEEMYPPEAAGFCNESQDSDNPCRIKEIEPLESKRRFQIIANEKPTEEELKQQKIRELEQYLSVTDWYAVRYAETGVEIPQDVRNQRQSAREEISRLRGDLDSQQDTKSEIIDNFNDLVKEPTDEDEFVEPSFDELLKNGENQQEEQKK